MPARPGRERSADQVTEPLVRVIVVGAGLAGLSAACHLRGAGHDVLVLERGDGPGGRAAELQVGPFRFDAGPTVFTLSLIHI